MIRSTHSRKKAPAGCLIPFGLLFLLIGLAVCWFAWTKVIGPAAKVRSWTESPCQVTQWEMEVTPGGDVYQLSPQVAYTYEFNGQSLTGRTYDATSSSVPSINEFEEQGVSARAGGTVCYVNPALPGESSYRRGSYTAGGFVLGMGLLFAGVGGLIVLRGIFNIFRRVVPQDVLPGPVRKGCAGGILAPLFFLFFAVIGFVVWKLALHGQPDWKTIGARMVPVPAQVVASGMHTSRSSGKNSSTTYKPKVAYRYEFQGRTWHSGWLDFDRGTTSSSNHGKALEAANRYPVDARPTAWVDPEAPWRAVLEKEAGNRWWLWLFPVVFGGIGILGLLGWFLKVTALGAVLFSTKRGAHL